MTASPNEGWKKFENGDEAGNVPLWQVLAQFRSEDLDEGLKENAEVINQAKPPSVWHYNLAFVISFIFGFLSLLFFIGLLIFARSEFVNFYFYLTLVTLTAAAAPHLWRQIYQYGLKPTEVPLELPYTPDPLFDEVLGYLQKVDGPKAYYLSRFRKKRVCFKRRQFFGRLRYFLFSEHSQDRSMFMRFPTAMPLPADIYLHRDDFEKILEKRNTKPEFKRKKEQGVFSKYPYEDAIVAVLGSQPVKALNLNEHGKTIRAIRRMLVDWLAQNSDETADAPPPRADYPRVKECAEKIFSILKNLSER